jgi:hypothetical protein
MAFEIRNEQYIGSGIIYVDGRDVGNVSNANFAIEVNTVNRPNFRGGGGNAATLERVSAVRLSLTLDSFNNENLALALRGKVDVLTAQTVTDAEYTVAAGVNLVRTAHMIDLAEPVTVKDELDQPLVKGTDFDVSAAGILPLPGGAISEDDIIKVSYTSVAGSALEALVESGAEVAVVMDGLNDNTGKRAVLDVYRWKPAPTTGLGLISEEFGEFPLEGEVLADTSKPVGKSQFFRRLAQN